MNVTLFLALLGALLCMSTTALTKEPVGMTNSASSANQRSLFGGRDFDAWVHLLHNDLDESTRWHAVKAIGVLGRRGREADALRELAPLVHSKEPAIAQSSHYALAELGKKGVSELITTLRDETYPYRESIIQSLGKAGPSAKPAVQVLLEISGDSDATLRRRAFESLLGIGEPADIIAQAIETEVDKNDDPHAANTIIFRLADSPLEYSVKERLLIKWLNSDDRNTAQSAATILATVGKNTDSVQNALRTSIRGYAADPNTRGACPNVGGKGINVELLLPLLIEVTQEQNLNDPKVRNGQFIRLFVGQVGEIGHAGRPAVQMLVKILAARKESHIAQVDADIVQSLWQIGAGAREALPSLESLKQEVAQNKTVRQSERDFWLKKLDRTIDRIRAAK